MPAIKVAKQRLGEHRHPEPFMARGVDKALAGQPVKRIADRRDASMQVFGQGRRLQPGAWEIGSRSKPFLESGVNSVEGAGRGHGRPSALLRSCRPALLVDEIGDQLGLIGTQGVGGGEMVRHPVAE